MRKAALLLILIFLTCKKVYFVTAESGLVLRDKPAPDGKALMTVPSAKEVEFVKDTGVSFTVEGRTGNWYEVKVDGLPGFVFSGFISHDSTVLSAMKKCAEKGDKYIQGSCAPPWVSKFGGVLAMRVECEYLTFHPDRRIVYKDCSCSGELNPVTNTYRWEYAAADREIRFTRTCVNLVQQFVIKSDPSNPENFQVFIDGRYAYPKAPDCSNYCL